MTYGENWQNEKQQKYDLLKMCIKYSCRSTHNHVQTDVPKKHLYQATQYDELLAVSVQIYKIRTHQRNIPQDKFAHFPILMYFFKIKLYVLEPAAATANMVRAKYFPDCQQLTNRLDNK